MKVTKGAKIRNRYNQVPYLTQDTQQITFELSLVIVNISGMNVIICYDTKVICHMTLFLGTLFTILPEICACILLQGSTIARFKSEVCRMNKYIHVYIRITQLSKYRGRQRSGITRIK